MAGRHKCHCKHVYDFAVDDNENAYMYLIRMFMSNFEDFGEKSRGDFLVAEIVEPVKSRDGGCDGGEGRRGSRWRR